MGVFDNANFDDPKTIGLLAAAAQMFNASAPSTKPTSFGQVFSGGLLGGLNAYQGARQQQQKDDMEKAQLDMLRVKLKKENDMQDMKNKWLALAIGGGIDQSPSNAAAALTQGAASGSIGPTVENAARMDAMPKQQPQSNNGILPLSMITRGAMIGMPGMKEQLEAYKYMNDPQKLEQGATYVNRADKTERTMPKLENGMQVINGEASFLPNYKKEIASQAGLTTAAQEAERAKYAPIPSGMELTGNNPPITMAELVASRSPQNSPNMPSLPQLPNMNSGGRPAIPPPTASGNSQPMPQGFPSQGGEGRVKTAAEKEAEIGAVRVKNAVDEANLKNYPEYVAKKQSAISSAQQALASINNTLRHPGLAAATGLQGTIDPRNYIPGTDAKNARVQIEQVKGQTFLSAYNDLRGAGAITEQEGRVATAAKARLDTAQSTGEYIFALNELKDIIQAGYERLKSTPDPVELSRNRGASAQNAGVQTPNAQPSQQPAMQEYKTTSKAKMLNLQQKQAIDVILQSGDQKMIDNLKAKGLIQ